MKISREFKVGSLIIMAIALLYWGMNFMKGNDIFSEHRTFYSIYDNIEGLSVNKPVLINGLQIGQISEIYFHPDNSGRLVVKFKIDSDYPIPDNSVARIHNMSILGERAVIFDLGDSFDMAITGDTLYSGVEGNLSDALEEELAPIKAKADKLLGSLDSTVVMLSNFLNKKTQGDFVNTVVNLSETFENLRKASESLERMIAANEDSINKFIGNLTAISQNLADNGENLDVILTNFSSITDTIVKADIYKTITDLNDVMSRTDSIMTKINNGEGSIGMLINDPELYDNLAESSNSLNRLLLDIKYNPNKYLQFSVFGSKERLSEEDIQELEEKRKELEKEQQNKEDNPKK